MAAASTRVGAARSLSLTASRQQQQQQQQETSSSSSSSAPWLWKKLHGSFEFDTPLSLPLRGVPAPAEAAPVPRASGGARLSTLPNGVRVVTPAAPDTSAATSANDLVATVGLYLNAGSRHENPATSGASHVVEAMAFRAGTLDRSAFRLARDAEATGGAVGCAAARESIAFTGEAMKRHAGELLRILAEVACKPRVLAYGKSSEADDDDIRAEVQEAVNVVSREMKETASKDAQTSVMEALHAAAYEGNTLGRFHAFRPRYFSSRRRRHRRRPAEALRCVSCGGRGASG